ncbi:hypothetical protein C8R45DRAFT_1193951 [Mycena sanguinolenta]|nr:hypothetical protein C8R45DRAFT_1193951 [Mycena sanguinolenta]
MWTSRLLNLRLFKVHHVHSSSAPRSGFFGFIRVPPGFGYLGCLLLQFPPAAAAALSDQAASVALSGPDRSLTTALQNVNGMSSVLALVPVLTGKVQNVKMIAARTFPASLVVAGVGGGRVLTKLQISMLLISRSLYHNLVDEFSYHHDEYVNKFSPEMIHIPTGTPERHASSVIINHNPSEAYLVEAWFQTQGQPARVSMQRNNVRRMLCGLLIYIIVRAGEVFIEIQNVATGAWFALLAFQLVSSFCWVVALILLQMNRGQSNPALLLNRLSNPDYRCQVVGLGHHVATALFSFHLECLTTCHMFGGNYDNNTLRTVGGLILISATADLVSTVLIVGLTTWAYPWLGMEMVMVMVKVGSSLEPLRQIEIKHIEPLAGQPGSLPPRKKDIKLPVTVNTTATWNFTKICVGHNVVEGAGKEWVSLDPGIWIG